MNYRKVSSKQMISKVYRDLKVPEYLTVADIVEWIGEAIEEIQHIGGFIEEKKSYTVSNSRLLIPHNVYYVDTVFYDGNKLPYGYAQSNKYTADVYLSAKTEVLETTNTEVTRYGSLSVDSSNLVDYYIVSGNWLQFSFEEGEVELLTYNYPIDDEGYPMIPDNQFYKQAIFWYITANMILGGFQHPSINFAYARRMFNTYRIKATGDMKFPTPDKFIRFSKIFNSVIKNYSYNDPKELL